MLKTEKDYQLAENHLAQLKEHHKNLLAQYNRLTIESKKQKENSRRGKAILAAFINVESQSKATEEAIHYMTNLLVVYNKNKKIVKDEDDGLL